MKIVKLEPKSNTADAIEYIRKKHAMYFLNGMVSDEQLKGSSLSFS